jgi:RNA polymerase sigma-70 factor (ECF subfamily)
MRLRRSPTRVPIATAAIAGDRQCAAPERVRTVMSNHPDDDTSLTLMMRVQQHPSDPTAWNEFAHRYQPMIRAWCLKWGSQSCDADDLAQQVLIKLISAMKTYRCDAGTSFRGWLKSVTHNAWIDFVRRPRAGQAPDWLSSIADSSDALEDLEQQMEQAHERELLELAMQRVEPRVKASTWEAFRLTSIESLSGADAAARLSQPVSNVFVAKHRVMKLLEEEVRILREQRR